MLCEVHQELRSLLVGDLVLIYCDWCTFLHGRHHWLHQDWNRVEMQEDVTLLQLFRNGHGNSDFAIVMVLAWPNRQEEVNLAVHCFSIQSLINHSSIHITETFKYIIMYWQLSVCMGQCRHCDHGTIAIHSIAKPSFGDRLNVINSHLLLKPMQSACL